MVSETHLIQLIFKAQTCKKCERNRERMQRQIVPKWLTKVCMWKRWNDIISGHYSLYININFLSFLFFLVLFVWLFFYFVLVFFQKSSKNQWEELVEKTCFVFFLKGLFLTREERTAFMMTFSSTPSPAILLLLIDSSQQCIPKSSSCQNANKQILIQQRIITHMYCQILTIPFVQLELQKNTPVQIWSHYTVQSPPATWHSHGKVWLPFAGLCQRSWEYCLSHSKEAAELELLQGGWLAVILKLDNVLLLNLCITYTISLFTSI